MEGKIPRKGECYLRSVTERGVKCWTIVVDYKDTGGLAYESEAHSQCCTATVTFLGEHGDPSRFERPILYHC